MATYDFLNQTSDPYNLQQYSPWLDKASITTPAGKDIYDTITSAGLDPLSSGVGFNYSGLQSWNPMGDTPINLDSLYSGYSLDNPKVLDLYTQALGQTQDTRLQDAYKSAMGFDQYKPDPYENTSFGSQNYGLSIGQLGLDFSKMFESPEFVNMANTWAGEQTAAAQTKDMQMGILDKLSTDPNFKYQTTMEDWKNAAAAVRASQPAPDPYANTSFSGGVMDIGPIGGIGKPLVGYLNGIPVYAGVANGVVTLGGQYFVDPSGNLTYMEGKEGKGGTFGKALKSFVTGGISDLAEGKKLGAGIGNAFEAALGKSKANLLQSLTGIPTFQASTGDGGTLLSNILGPADDYFYGTSPMQVLGDKQSTKDAVNTAAKVVGTIYLGGVGAAYAGGAGSLGAATAWPSTMASGTALGGAAGVGAAEAGAATALGGAAGVGAAETGAATAAGDVLGSWSGWGLGADALGSSLGIGGVANVGAGADALLALGADAGLGATEVGAAGAGGDVLGSWSGWGLGGDAIGSSLGIGGVSNVGAGADLLGGTAGVGAGGSLLGNILGSSGGSSMLGTLLNAGLLAGTSYLAGEQAQENAEENAEKNYALWNQNAYPRADRVNAMLMQDYAQLADQLRGVKESLMEDYAQRGIKGGGIVGGGLATLDRAGMSERAKALQNVLEFANTPMFSPTGVAINNTESGESNLYNTLGTLGSMYLYNNLLGSGNNNSGNDYTALLLSQMLK